MKKLSFLTLISAFIIPLVWVACSQSSTKHDLVKVSDSLFFVTLNPIEAMNDPSKHAWDLFMFVNHPAKDYTKGRGIADSSRKIGAPGLVVWETWKHAGTEVFLDKGQAPPSWEDFSLDPYLNKKGKIFESSTVTIIAQLNAQKKNLTQILNELRQGGHIFFNPDDGLPANGGGETRMNKSTFDFIINNKFYNKGELIKYRNAVLATPPNERKQLSFEKTSIEVKAMWLQFSDAQLKSGEDKKYYVAIDAKGVKYGLTSLHIITKEIPNWFWCSFRHKDTPKPEIPSIDNHGLPSELKGIFWENYELSGTQTSFTDAQGNVVKLSDPVVEHGFENSSCMSCHATSVVGADGGKLLFMDPKVQATFPRAKIFGVPNPSWFKNADGKDDLLPLDFVYSIAFRTQGQK